MQTLDNIPVLYLSTTDIPSAIPALWEKLDAIVPEMKARKCYGAVVNGREYWAAVERREGDGSHPPELAEGIIEGGNYVTEFIPDWRSQNLPVVIPAACKKLSAEHSIDPDGPIIEYYTSDGGLAMMMRLA